MIKYYKLRNALYEVSNNTVYFICKQFCFPLKVTPLRIISVFTLNELLNNSATKEITKEEIEKELLK